MNIICEKLKLNFNFKNYPLYFFLFLLLQACSNKIDKRGPLTFEKTSEQTDAVLNSLRALPGVEVNETTQYQDTVEGFRRFSIFIWQNTDHTNPSLGKFRQKLVLFHRGFSEPMLLQTSGYKIFAEYLSGLTKTFQSNQLQVEHRFFGESVPQPKDWTKLTIRQSAEDFHHIVEVFKKIYSGAWVNTGSSKGGMTSIYHRRFYPADVAGTIANVAPLSFSVEDSRYVDFLKSVGGDKYAACRANLNSFQLNLLRRRSEILPAVSNNFSILGGKNVGFEHSVVELPFIFWQYGNPEEGSLGCGAIPNENASAEQLGLLLRSINDPEGYNDEQLLVFQPYSFQSAVELGAPGIDLSHLKEFQQEKYELSQYLPQGISYNFLASSMLDIQDWVAREATNLIFFYGEYDPWTAGAFRDIRLSIAYENYWYLIPGANHSANLSQLPETQKQEALATLARWFGKSPIKNIDNLSTIHNLPTAENLEDLEFKARKKL